MQVAFRVDASPGIGVGHLMRCLALSNALRDRGARTLFVSAPLEPAWKALVAGSGATLLGVPAVGAADDAWRDDARASELALEGQGAIDWLVVDGYRFDARWESALRGRVRHLLVVDDLADRAHDCDLLLDQNFDPQAEALYRSRVPEACQLLLGPRFALLQPELRALRETRRDPQAPLRRVVVSFGGTSGGDTALVALAGIQAAAIAGLEVDVAIGWSSPQRAEIAAAAAPLGACRVHEGAKLSDLLASADAAIGAGGTTTWERACLGVPSIVIATASNQERVSRALGESGAVLYLGPARETSPAAIAAALCLLARSPALRTHLSRASRALADGAGVQRVASEMRAHDLLVRPALEADAADVYRWRNDPETRRQSFNPLPLPWQEHQAWFRGALLSGDRVILIAELDGASVGVLRFDVSGDTAAVSVFLDPAQKGRGLGPALLRAGRSWLLERRPEIRRLNAEVQAGNPASQRAFLKAGFTESFRTYQGALGDDSE